MAGSFVISAFGREPEGHKRPLRPLLLTPKPTSI
jgi:hypothetical protein